MMFDWIQCIFITSFIEEKIQQQQQKTEIRTMNTTIYVTSSVEFHDETFISNVTWLFHHMKLPLKGLKSVSTCVYWLCSASLINNKKENMNYILQL